MKPSVSFVVTAAVLMALMMHVYSQDKRLIQSLLSPHQIETRSRVRLCGRHLVEALQLICKGNYYSNIKRGPAVGIGNDEDESAFLSSKQAKSMLMKRDLQYRGVYDECCVKGCSWVELNSYCGSK